MIIITAQAAQPSSRVGHLSVHVCTLEETHAGARYVTVDDVRKLRGRPESPRSPLSSPGNTSNPPGGSWRSPSPTQGKQSGKQSANLRSPRVGALSVHVADGNGTPRRPSLDRVLNAESRSGTRYVSSGEVRSRRRSHSPRSPLSPQGSMPSSKNSSPRGTPPDQTSPSVGASSALSRDRMSTPKRAISRGSSADVKLPPDAAASGGADGVSLWKVCVWGVTRLLARPLTLLRVLLPFLC